MAGIMQGPNTYACMSHAVSIYRSLDTRASSRTSYQNTVSKRGKNEEKSMVVKLC